MANDDVGAVLLGVLGLAGLVAIMIKSCPYCKKPQTRGTSICTNCNRDI